MTIDLLRVLLIEDSEDDADLVSRELNRHRPAHIERVEDEASMRAALEANRCDVILCDWSLPTFNAPDALRIVKEMGIDIPFIIVSGTIGEEMAVEGMRAGAHDYVLKGRLTRLAPALDRELRECQNRRAHRQTELARRNAEHQLLHAQKLEAIGTLAGGIAHDFNNLLSVILSYSSLLADDPSCNEQARADLEEISKAGSRARDLTRQLLAFSRQQVLQPRVIDPNEVVGGIEKMLRRLLGADVELLVLGAPDLGRVKVDPGQLEQIIMNLAVNARDAMPGGGRLTIETANVHFDELYARAHDGVKPGAYVMLAANDTGSGMDRPTQARIFEPFFTTKEKGKGTGLGLSTVFGIVRQSGGHISVASEPGRGSSFKIYFPRTDHPAEASSPPSLRPRTLSGGETILLVEDEEAVRTLARTILRRAGYQVLEAQSAGDAFLLCEQHTTTIDLLLTDVVMPRMSGRKLAARLQTLRAKMKVLYISGYVDESLADQDAPESNAAFLEKPITPTRLLQRVREVLDTPHSPG
jgi:signal transduction histidine kinase